MSKAESGKTVHVHYTGRLADGTVFDSSQDSDPLEFQVGAGQVIRGFDDAVAGMAAGEEKTVTIPAVDAYGPRESELLLNVSRDILPEDVEPEVGHQLHLRTQDGQTFQATIVDVHDEHLELDANHPLAGQDLTFDILLVKVG